MRAWIIWQYIKTIATTVAAAAIMWLISGDSILPLFASVFIKVIAVVIFLSGILLAVLKDLKTRKYECTSCHHKFVADIKCGWRQKCPQCGAPAEFIDRDIPF